MLLQIWNTQSCRSRVAPDLAYYLNFRQDPLFSSPPVSQVSGIRRISQTSSSFFSQFSSIWPFLKFDYPVLRTISRRPERLSSWIQQYSLCICCSVPSLLVAAAVLLHIWNLPNEMTRKQSCYKSERRCSRSGIHSPVAAVSVQIWHIMNIRQDSSWCFSCPLVSQVSGLTSEISPAIFFLSVLINLTISEI